MACFLWNNGGPWSEIEKDEEGHVFPKEAALCRLRMTQRQTQTMDKIERRFTLEPFQIRVSEG